MKNYTINFDGACNPTNPGGYMGYGFLVKEGDKELIAGSDYKDPHPNNTNNVAEYQACINALEFIYFHTKENNIDNYHVTVMGDSKLVIMQMNNIWKIKSGYYKEKALECKQFIDNNLKGKVKFKWIPREDNTIADKLSGEALSFIR